MRTYHRRMPIRSSGFNHAKRGPALPAATSVSGINTTSLLPFRTWWAFSGSRYEPTRSGFHVSGNLATNWRLNNTLSRCCTDGTTGSTRSTSSYDLPPTSGIRTTARSACETRNVTPSVCGGDQVRR